MQLCNKKWLTVYAVICMAAAIGSADRSPCRSSSSTTGRGNDHAGVSVAVGDVNGDGTADLIIGADGGALGGITQSTGYVLVLSGPDC